MPKKSDEQFARTKTVTDLKGLLHDLTRMETKILELEQKAERQELEIAQLTKQNAKLKERVEKLKASGAFDGEDEEWLVKKRATVRFSYRRQGGFKVVVDPLSGRRGFALGPTPHGLLKLAIQNAQ